MKSFKQIVKENPFTTASESVHWSDYKKSHIDWAEVKEYAIEFKTEYRASLVGITLAVLVATYLAHFILLKFVFPEVPSDSVGYIVIQAISCIIFLLVYIAEASNIISITRRLKMSSMYKNKARITSFRWASAAFIVIMNVFCTSYGIYHKTVSEDKTVAIIHNNITKDSTNIVAKYDADIKYYQGQIWSIKANAKATKKGTLTDQDKKLISDFEQSLKDSRAERHTEIDRFRDESKQLITETKGNLDNWIYLKIGLALLLEIIIIGCAYSISNYRVNIAKNTEALKHQFENNPDKGIKETKGQEVKSEPKEQEKTTPTAQMPSPDGEKKK